MPSEFKCYGYSVKCNYTWVGCGVSGGVNVQFYLVMWSAFQAYHVCTKDQYLGPLVVYFSSTSFYIGCSHLL